MAATRRRADHGPMNTSSPRTTRPALERSTGDRMVAGVAGGLSRYFDVDPVLVRVAFAVTTLFSGAGLLAYLLLWILVPRDDTAVEPPTGAAAAAA